MKPPHIALGLVLLAAAFAGGVYVQHRWPLGRWLKRDEPGRVPVTEATVAALRTLPRAQRLVIVVAGQSNAANYGGSPRAGGAGVYAFADGRIFPAVDPLPGGDARRGSIWTRLGARLIHGQAAEAVVFAVVAQGSTHAVAWAPGGSNHARLLRTLETLAGAGLPVDLVLWQQGESDAGQADAAGADYARTLGSVAAACRKLAPEARFVVARATYHAAIATNDQIRLAQSAVASGPGMMAGPDLDMLRDRFRSDGVHFSDEGLDAAADLWLGSLRPYLLERQPGPRAP